MGKTKTLNNFQKQSKILIDNCKVLGLYGTFAPCKER